MLHITKSSEKWGTQLRTPPSHHGFSRWDMHGTIVDVIIWWRPILILVITSIGCLHESNYTWISSSWLQFLHLTDLNRGVETLFETRIRGIVTLGKNLIFLDYFCKQTWFLSFKVFYEIQGWSIPFRFVISSAGLLFPNHDLAHLREYLNPSWSHSTYITCHLGIATINRIRWLLCPALSNLPIGCSELFFLWTPDWLPKIERMWSDLVNPFFNLTYCTFLAIEWYFPAFVLTYCWYIQPTCHSCGSIELIQLRVHEIR